MTDTAVTPPSGTNGSGRKAGTPRVATAARTVRDRSGRTGGLMGYVFVTPMTLYLLAIMAIPLLWALWISFTDKRVGMPGEFIGLVNYGDILTDPLFWRTAWNTVVFTVGAVVLKIVFGLAMALVLNENFRGRSLYRVLLFLPWTVPTIVSVFAWQWMFSDVGGPLNAILKNMGLVSAPVPWLTDPNLALHRRQWSQGRHLSDPARWRSGGSGW